MTVTVSNPGLSGGQKSINYTVLSSDTTATIASGISAAIDADVSLNGLRLSASNSSQATLAWSQSFTAAAPSGANVGNLVVSAIDGSGNQASNRVLSSNSNISANVTYDANGNMLTDGQGNIYTWDSNFRLTQIQYPSGNSSTFTYDCFNHCVSIVETAGGAVTSTKQFVWSDGKMCESRDASSNLLSQYFDQGQTISGANYFFTRDHLGSIRDVTDSSGTRQTHYDYTPFGQVMQTGSLVSADFQFCGMYVHAPSQLNLATYRAYQPSSARWLSRDPIAESGGLNLYDYVENRPLTAVDLSGLDAIILLDPNALGGLGHCAVLVGNDSTGWTYFSNEQHYQQNQPTGPGSFSDLNQFFSAYDRYSPNNSLRFQNDNDQAGIDAGKNSVCKFNFCKHNCANTCRDILKAMGINLGNGGWFGTGLFTTPGSTFNAGLRAGGQPLIMPPM